MADQTYKTVTTNLGRNALQVALSQGSTVQLTHMAVGDGNGSPVTPQATMTALVHEVYRANINLLTVDPDNPDQITAELVIPQSVGGFFIREVGLFLADGTLFAIGNTPLTEKTDIQSGSATDMSVKMVFRVQDASLIQLVIDPAQVLATREYVDSISSRVQKTWTLSAPVESGGTLTLPDGLSYIVGRDQLLLFWNGYPVDAGAFAETGNAGTVSTSIKLLFSAASGDEMQMVLFGSRL